MIREGESFPGPITIERGRELLEKDLAWVEAALARHVKVPLTQNEYDALCSFIFNVGSERFRTSTLLYRLNSGDRAAVAKEWLRWNKGRVMGKLKVINGLKARRESELKLFLNELANARMRAETKSKRRVTLSIVGLGWMDESERDTLPQAKSIIVDHETGEILDSLPVPHPPSQKSAHNGKSLTAPASPEALEALEAQIHKAQIDAVAPASP